MATISRRSAAFLVVVGVWSWFIWPTFLRNIWKDPRSWHHGATSFFLVHLVLVVASLAIGTAVAWVGVAGLRSRPAAGAGPAGPDPADPADAVAGGLRDTVV